MKIIFFFLILFLAILAGLAIKTDSGYILVAYHHWTIETTLWAGLLTIVLVFFVLHYFIRFLVALQQTPRNWRRFLKYRSYDKSHSLTAKGILELLEKNWVAAEKLLSKSAKTSSIPVINHLAASYAADKMGDIEKRDHHLHHAHDASPEEEVVITLVRAKLQLENKQYEQALASLQRLQQMVPEHPAVLMLLKDAYVETENWSKLKDLLPSLRKRKLFSEEQFNELATDVYAHCIGLSQLRLELLESAWNDIPKGFRFDHRVLHAYILGLIKFKKDDLAAELIESTIKKSWNSDLVRLYAKIKTGDLHRQLEMAEKWLKIHPGERDLLIALGILSAKFKLWAKAKEYLNEAYKIKKDNAIFSALAYVFEKEGDYQTAVEYYRRALSENDYI